jgi:hypothetical protein
MLNYIKKMLFKLIEYRIIYLRFLKIENDEFANKLITITLILKNGKIPTNVIKLIDMTKL